jgi:hypothetical protein
MHKAVFPNLVVEYVALLFRTRRFRVKMQVVTGFSFALCMLWEKSQPPPSTFFAVPYLLLSLPFDTV